LGARVAFPKTDRANDTKIKVDSQPVRCFMRTYIHSTGKMTDRREYVQ